MEVITEYKSLIYGNYVSKLGGTSSGTGNGQFNNPQGITTNDTHVLVSDTANHRIQIFELSSYLVSCADGQIRNTTGTCVIDNMLPVITVDGNSTNRTVTTPVGEPYTVPTGVVTDNDASYTGSVTHNPSTIDITSPETFTIQYDAPDDASGNEPVPVILTVNVACAVGQIFNGTTCVAILEHVLTFGESGVGDAQFDSPRGIATNSTHFFVVDENNNRVQILDINGNYVDQFGDSGNGALSTPQGITTNSTHLFVVDTGTDRVLVFDINGNYVKSFGISGSGDGSFDDPRGIATNNTHLFVTDRNNDRVEIFDIDGNYAGQFGGGGTNDGNFFFPLAITINNTHIFVVDNTQRVQIFDINGTFVSKFGSSGSGDGQFNAAGGIATTATHIFVADTGNNRIQVFDDMGNYAGQFGGSGNASGQFNSPNDIVTNGTHLYISDTNNNRVQIFALSSVLIPATSCADGEIRNTTGTCIIDTEKPTITVNENSTNRTVTTLVGEPYTVPVGTVTDNDPAYNETVTVATTPSTVDTASPGSFNVTYTALADAAGNEPLPVVLTVIVSCPAGQSFDGTTCVEPESIEPVLSFGSEGNGTGEFGVLEGITTNSTHIFVADIGNNRIQIFDINGTFVSTFGSWSGLGNNPADGLFRNPNGVATNNTHIFVVDSGNSRVQIFDNSGTYLSQFGRGDTPNGRSAADGEFDIPFGIITDGTHLFISETGNNRIQILDTDGNYVSKFGNDTVFANPRGIAINSTHIFVIDSNNNRVQIFDHSGNHVKSFGSKGNGTGEFSFPRGIATNNMHLFVSDTSNSRVQIFDHTGNYVSQFGSLGNGSDQFKGPRGIAANDTHLFVVDNGNARIQVFALSSLILESCPDGQIRNATGTCVIDTEKPVITVDGNSDNRTVTVIVGDPYTVLAGNVTDNDESYSGTITITPTPGPVDTSMPGNFTIRYTALADAAGNTPFPVILTVNVMEPDTTLPVITVDGSSENSTVTITTGVSYIVPAGNVTDNDPAYNEIVTPNPSSINTTNPGIFPIRYTAPADAAGNTPLLVILTVNVACPVSQIFNGSSCVAILEHVSTFGSTGSGNLEFMDPHGIITNGTHLFIADFSNNRVQVFDINGNYVYTIGSQGTGNGQFNGLVGLTTNNTHLFVADYDNDRVQVFDINGTYLSQFGESGSTNDQFSFPQRIITNDTHLFIADTSNHRVQVYDINGNYAYTIGSAGPGDGQFNRPNGIATNGTHLFIVDTNNNRVQIFDFNGSYVAQFGGIGPADGQLNTPYAITSTDSYILVTEGGNDRIQIFDHAGNYISKLGSLGTDDGQFNNPQGITTNDTHVLVSDTANNRIQVFQLASLMSCADGQIRDAIGGCIDDTILPVITASSTNITLQVGDTFTPPTVTVSDNNPDYVGNVTNSTTPSMVDTSSAGSFTITYNATADAAGNAPIPVNVTVNVIDTTLPIIKVNGSSENRTITIPVDVSSSVPTGVVTDNDPAYSGTVTAEPATIITIRPGSFNVTYMAPADAAGNTPNLVLITVNVACPVDQIFNGTTCIATLDHVLSLGNGSSSADGEFRSPQGITTTITHLYIADTDNNRIQILDINGTYVSKFGSQGTADGQFNSPRAITTTTTHLYIADTENHRIQIFDINGTYVSQFGSEGTADGQFNSPQGITTNGTHLFVADTENHRIQIFDNTGNYAGQFGSNGGVDGEFRSPRGIATNSTHIFVADSANHRIQIFNVNGTYVSTIGGTGPGFGGYGTANGEFERPQGITTTATHIFVADTNNNRIQIFDINGTYVSQFRSQGSENGNFTSPHKIATNFTHLYISDTGNNRVQIFALSSVLQPESCADSEIRDTTGTCVIDDVLPVITASSINITLQIGDTFTPPIVTLFDNDPAYSGTITNTTDPGPVDTSSAGTFTITYNATADASNNAPILVNVTVNVIDTTAPIITVNGNSTNRTVITPVGEPYTILAGNVTDNDPAYNETVTANSTLINTTSLGTFPILYTASADAAGNTPIPVVLTIIISCPDDQSFNGTTCITPESITPESIIPEFVKSFGSTGFGIGEFTVPHGVATNFTHIFIVDTENNRIQIFDINGTFVKSFGGVGNTSGQFNTPHGIATNNTHLYIVDTANHRVQSLDNNGNYVSQFGSNGAGNGEFDFPIEIATNNTHLFVADPRNHRIQIFDNTGNYTGQFGSNGTGNGEFDLPRGIATNNTHLFVADTNNNRIQIFDINGTYVSQFGGTGSNDGEFRNPEGITTISTHIFVSDTNNHRVQIFDNAGNYAGQFGSEGSENGNFTEPTGIATNNTHLYIADSGNNRVQIFALPSSLLPEPCADDEIRVINGTCIIDTTPPIITVSNTTITLQIGQTFTPPTVTISDNDPSYVGTITNSTTPDIVDTSSVGTFTITYMANADASGNAPNMVNVTVTVSNCNSDQILDSVTNTCITDIAPPTISASSTNIPLQIGDTFTPPTVNVTDNDPSYVGIVTNSTSPGMVDTNTTGIFIITYNATADASNNAPIPVNVTVNVTDTTAPTIETGPTNITLQIGATFTPPSVNVTDNDPSYVGTITNTTSPGMVDTSSAGVFTITYNATADAAGNVPNMVNVTVTVSNCNSDQILDSVTNTCITDITPPTISVDGSSENRTIPVHKDASYTLPAPTINDNDPNYNRTVTVFINGTSFDVTTPFNTTSVGIFNVTYNAPADTAGNAPFPVVLTVNVTIAPDTTPPLITVDGRSDNRTVTTPVGEPYTVPTGVVTDGDPAYNETVTHTPTSINTTAPGTFTITYNTTADDAGNSPLPVVLTVIVSCPYGQSFNVTACIGLEVEHVLTFRSSGNLQFSSPEGLTTTDTNIFIVDRSSNRIQVSDHNGNYVNTIGGTGTGFKGSGSGNGEFTAPRGITTNSTHLYIVDTNNHRVQIFYTNGTYISQFGSFGSADGQFDLPRGITTNNTHLFVTDTNNNRVQIFDINGTYVSQFGSEGTGDGQFNSPSAITTNNTHVFVVDSDNDRIQIFDNTGNYAGQFGSSGGITASYTYIFVADPVNHRIQIFDHNGTYISQFGSEGSADGQFSEPLGIATNNTHIFVADIQINRVQIFEFATIIPCTDIQVRNDAGICVADTTPPVIIAKPSSVTVLQNANYSLPPPTVTDNNPSFNGSFTASQNIAPLNTSSIETITITYTATDLSNNTGTATQSIDIVAQCATNQILDSTGALCITDIILPLITVNGSSENRTISVTIDESYAVPAGVVTDNDGNYSESVTITPGSINTTLPGTFTISYTAPADAAGNTPFPVVFTVNIACPVGQIFDGNSCVAILEHVLTFGSTGNGNGQFNNPHGIITNDTHIFIVDFSNNRVQVYDHNGNYTNTIGSVGLGNGKFVGPVGITTNDTHVFVADFNLHRIQIFSVDGTFVKSFGSNSTGSADGQFNKPERIATNGTHLFVADTKNHRIQIFDINGNYVDKFGYPGAGDGRFNLPHGITISNDQLYIVDRGNNRVQVFDTDGNYLNRFGSTGSGNGEFSNPRAITSTDSYIFVADAGNNRVQIFDVMGNYVNQVGSLGASDGQFNNPLGITANNTRVLVSDTNNNRIQIFQLASLLPCTDAGQLRDNIGACIDDTMLPVITVNGSSENRTIMLTVGDPYTVPTGTVTDNDESYSGTISTTPASINTASPGTFNVTYTAPADAAGNEPLTVVLTVNISCPVDQIFNGSSCVAVLEHVSSFGSPGNGTLQFTNPHGITTNDTHIFIVDFSNNRVQVYDHNGNYANTIGITNSSGSADDGKFNQPVGITANNTHVFVADFGNHRIQIFDVNGTFVSKFGTGSAGDADGQFSSPQRITTNGTHLFVADSGNHRVQIFDINGNYVSKFGVSGISADGQFNSPQGIIATSTHLYVADTSNNRVQVFDHNGNFVNKFGSVGSGNGEFNNPRAITSTDTHIFVADTSNHRIQIFDHDGNYVSKLGGPSPGTANGKFNQPVAITANDTHVFVADFGNHRIQIFQIASLMSCADDEIRDGTGACIVDIELPLITVNGSSDNRTVTTPVGVPYTVPTGNVTDNDPAYSETVAVNTTSIDTSSVGTFAILYTASADASGNEPLPVVLTILVEAPPLDTTPPEIMVDPTSITLEIGATFTPPTVTVSDNVDGYVGIISNTTTPSGANASSVGVFTITYNATADAAGNAPIPVNVTVNVTDTTAPVIEVNSTTITLQIGATFTPPTVNVTDNDPAYSGTISNSTTPSDVDTGSAGAFIITYNATADASGNTPVPVEVTVTVQAAPDNTPPTFTLEGANPQTITVGTAYAELGATCNDETDGVITPIINSSNVNVTTIGDYTVTYDCADVAGNDAPQLTRTVNVVAASDTTSPTIELDGANPQTITVGTAYAELGATCNDETDGAINPITVNVVAASDTTSPTIELDGANPQTITVGTAYAELGATCNDETDGAITPIINSSNVNVTTIGDYTVTYDCADVAGNDAPQLTRTVNVVAASDTTSPTIELDGANPQTITVGTAYAELGATCNDETDGAITPIINSSNVNVTTIGDYTVTYDCADVAGNDAPQLTRTVNVVAASDTTSPTIELDGANPQTITVGTAYAELGATCNDETDGAITPIINSSNVNVTTIGDYTVTYDCADAAGNDAPQLTRTVNVVAASDTTSPTIELDGANPQTITVGTAYAELGATCNDETDGAITPIINSSNVNVTTIGDYTVTYDCADVAGNDAPQLTRTVNVVAASDTTSPTIELDGANPQTITVGTAYAELGATCNDETDGAITPIINSSNVNVTTIGDYTVTYDCADVAGNDAPQLTRTVNVVAASDTTSPTIELDGANPQTITVGTAYAELGATCNDETDGAITPIINSSNVNVTTIGDYTVTYDCADVAGNDAPQLTRTVNVVAASDTTSPTIELDGANPQTITVGTAYAELGATCNDETDGAITPIINSSSVDTSTAGSYTVTYDCADVAGNDAPQLTRTVNVVEPDAPDTEKPVIEVDGDSANRTITLTVGDPYTTPIGVVMDNDQDYSGTVMVFGAVDTSSPGMFRIIYRADADAAGNMPDIVVLDVTVMEPDTEKPVITVDGNSINRTITLTVGDPYTVPVVNVTDNDRDYSGTVTVLTVPSAVDTSSAETFNIIYTADADAAGNSPDSVEHIVYVVEPDAPDTEKPVITVDRDSANRTITLTVGDPYTVPVVNVTDNDRDYSGTVTVLTVPSAVDTSSAETFNIIYTANADAAGNSPDSVELIVHVVEPDTEKPVIEVDGDSANRTITLTVGDPYTTPIGVVMDNDQDYSGTVMVFGAVDTSSPGSFRTIYRADADAAGNMPDIVVLTIMIHCPVNQILVNDTCITDTTPPRISVNPTDITLEIDQTFTPPTVTISDNDRSYTGTVRSNTTSINTTSIGTFIIQYTASPDAAGNVPIPVNATVNVIDTTLPVIRVDGDNTNRTVTTTVGVSYTVPTGVVMDNDRDYSETVAVNTTSIDANTTGTFYISYTASADAAGNAPLPIILTVQVVACPPNHILDTTNTCVIDSAPPTITVNGNSTNRTETILLNSSYTVPTGVVMDNDNNYMGSITTPDSISTASVGIHTITYSAPADAAGNEPLPVILTVQVVAPCNNILESSTCVDGNGTTYNFDDLTFVGLVSPFDTFSTTPLTADAAINETDPAIVAYSIFGNPTGTTINPNTGVFIGALDASHVGNYTLLLDASFGTGNASKQITLAIPLVITAIECTADQTRDSSTGTCVTTTTPEPTTDPELQPKTRTNFGSGGGGGGSGGGGSGGSGGKSTYSGICGITKCDDLPLNIPDNSGIPNVNPIPKTDIEPAPTPEPVEPTPTPEPEPPKPEPKPTVQPPPPLPLVEPVVESSEDDFFTIIIGWLQSLFGLK